MFDFKAVNPNAVYVDADAATAGYQKFVDFLKTELLPAANEEDAIGRERYSLFSRSFLGAKIDSVLTIKMIRQ